MGGLYITRIGGLMRHDVSLAVDVDEEYPDLLRRIAGVFGRCEGKIQLSKNSNIVELAKFVRGQVKYIAQATRTTSKRDQVRVVLYCLEYLQSETAQQKLVYCTAQKAWSLDRSYIISMKGESQRINEARSAGISSKPRRIKRSRQRAAA